MNGSEHLAIGTCTGVVVAGALAYYSKDYVSSFYISDNFTRLVVAGFCAPFGYLTMYDLNKYTKGIQSKIPITKKIPKLLVNLTIGLVASLVLLTLMNLMGVVTTEPSHINIFGFNLTYISTILFSVVYVITSVVLSKFKISEHFIKSKSRVYGILFNIITPLILSVIVVSLSSDFIPETISDRLNTIQSLSFFVGIVLAVIFLYTGVVKRFSGLDTDLSKSALKCYIITFVLLFFGLSTEWGTFIILCMLGGCIGSLAPDLDQWNAVSTQVLNLLGGLTIIGVIITLLEKVILVNTDIHFNFINLNVYSNINPLMLLPLILMIVFTKMSSHRQFSHKWFGTLLFCLSVFLVLPLVFSIAFTAGYLSHIGADYFTKDYKNLKFYAFLLPCQNYSPHTDGKTGHTYFLRSKVDIGKGINQLFNTMKKYSLKPGLSSKTELRPLFGSRGKKKSKEKSVKKDEVKTSLDDM